MSAAEEEENPLVIPASMQGETSMGGLGLSVSCTGNDLEDDDDDDDIELLRSMAIAKEQSSTSTTSILPDSGGENNKQQQESFSVVVQQPSGTSSIGDSFAFNHARQTTEEGADWSSASRKQQPQLQEESSTNTNTAAPKVLPDPQPVHSSAPVPPLAGSPGKRVVKKVTISPQALESEEAAGEKKREQMKALSEALENSARAGETTTDVAGSGDLQSTINPTPEQILQSKLLIRKESKQGRSGSSLKEDGSSNFSGSQEDSQQWGSLVHKPMKARPQFYTEENSSSGGQHTVIINSPAPPPSTHLPGIRTEISMGDYTSNKPNNTQQGNNISSNSPPTTNLTQSHSSSISGGLTTAGTAPSSTNSLHPGSRLHSELGGSTKENNTVSTSPPARLPPLQ